MQQIKNDDGFGIEREHHSLLTCYCGQDKEQKKTEEEEGGRRMRRRKEKEKEEEKKTKEEEREGRELKNEKR